MVLRKILLLFSMVIAADWSNWDSDDSDDVLEIRWWYDARNGMSCLALIHCNGQLLKLNAAAAAVTVILPQIILMFYDGGATAIPKVESIADLATAMAGAGITATNGVFSTDASSTPNENYHWRHLCRRF